MRVAMLGQRGIPATFGGVERHVEELSARLVAAGASVTVFGRPGYTSTALSSFRGVQLRQSRGFTSKHFEAISYTFTAMLSTLSDQFDIVHIHGLGPAVLGLPVRAQRGRRLVVTVHGMDHKRDKWGTLARPVFHAASGIGVRAAHEVIAVSEAVAADLQKEFGVDATYIPNGVTQPPSSDADPPLGLKGTRYLLAVGRLVPEKGHLDLIRAFRQIPDSDLRLVIAGGTSHAGQYERRLRLEASQDSRVIMPGYLYGAELEALYRHATIFIQPSYIEGMPLTLLEAMSRGIPVLASDIDVHEQILRKFSMPQNLFPKGDTSQLAFVLRSSLKDSTTAPHAKRVSQTVLRAYSWEQSSLSTVSIYERCLGNLST